MDASHHSTLAQQRGHHHPDLTPLAAGTFLGANRSLDALGIAHGEGRETHGGARAAVRAALEQRQRHR